MGIGIGIGMLLVLLLLKNIVLRRRSIALINQIVFLIKNIEFKKLSEKVVSSLFGQLMILFVSNTFLYFFGLLTFLIYLLVLLVIGSLIIVYRKYFDELERIIIESRSAKIVVALVFLVIMFLSGQIFLGNKVAFSNKKIRLHNVIGRISPQGIDILKRDGALRLFHQVKSKDGKLDSIGESDVSSPFFKIISVETPEKEPSPDDPIIITHQRQRLPLGIYKFENFVTPSLDDQTTMRIDQLTNYIDQIDGKQKIKFDVYFKVIEEAPKTFNPLSSIKNGGVIQNPKINVTIFDDKGNRYGISWGSGGIWDQSYQPKTVYWDEVHGYFIIDKLSDKARKLNLLFDLGSDSTNYGKITIDFSKAKFGPFAAN